MVVILAFEDSLAGVVRSKFGFGCGKRAPVRGAHLPWWGGRVMVVILAFEDSLAKCCSF